MRKRPEAAGLYDPGYEHDNCGIGAVADLTGAKKHETVTRALTVLDHLEHRGASGAEIDTGDGAGLLCQVPDEFFRAVLDFEVPQAGEYAVGVMFLPSDDEARRRDLEGLIERTIAAEGQTLLGWRDVPVDHSVPGPSASEVEPTIRQVFIG
jgi:glutamate synthase (NADPH/NADH) large chain